MSRRRRRRRDTKLIDRAAMRSQRREAPQETAMRSRLARLARSTIAPALVRHAARREILRRATTPSRLSAVHKTKVLGGGRRRLLISSAFAQAKHGSRLATLKCVKEKLSRVAQRVTGASSGRRRIDVRREVIQSARRSC